MFSNFFPSLAHPRIAILGLAGRSKRSMDGLSSFVEHGLHMVPWTWPPGCDVDRSSGSGRPKGRLQSRRVQAQDELESGASDACVWRGLAQVAGKLRSPESVQKEG